MHKVKGEAKVKIYGANLYRADMLNGQKVTIIPPGQKRGEKIKTFGDFVSFGSFGPIRAKPNNIEQRNY